MVCGDPACKEFLKLDKIFKHARKVRRDSVKEWSVTLPAGARLQEVANAFPAFLDFVFYGDEKKPFDPSFLVALFGLASGALGSNKVADKCMKACEEFIIKDRDNLVKFCADAVRILPSSQLQEFSERSSLVTDVSNQGVWLKVLEANGQVENNTVCCLLSEFVTVLAAHSNPTDPTDTFLDLTHPLLLPPPSESAKEALRLVQLENQFVGGVTDGVGVEELSPLQQRLAHALAFYRDSVSQEELQRTLQRLPLKSATFKIMDAALLIKSKTDLQSLHHFLCHRSGTGKGDLTAVRKAPIALAYDKHKSRVPLD